MTNGYPAAPELRVLLVEDSQGDSELALRELRRGGVSCRGMRVDTETAFRREIVNFEPQVILSDFSMPSFDGLRALALAQELATDVPFIFVSGTIGEENAIRALKDGATDYVLKHNLLRLLPAVERALREAKVQIERRRADERLARLAQYDELTGLPNRGLLMDRLGLALAQARRHGWRVGVMFIDLDGFKAVNDSCGHAVGDKLLAHVGPLLRRATRGGDTVARVGGDEFAALLPMLNRIKDAQAVAQKLARALVQPVVIEGHRLTASASIGISIFPWDGEDGDTLLRMADLAMYLAKRLGGNQHRFYDAEMTLPPRRDA
jgi:diguanylate cyclase (GGDEF)-like protein